MLKEKIFRKYPLCGKKGSLFFYFYNPFAYAYRFFFSEKKKDLLLKEDLKILLCCEAALGDVLLATAIIPSLKKQFPSCRIGFLCKKETACVLESQSVDFIHSSKQIKEIRKIQYDISLELHPFFRSSIPLMRKAKIPSRIGFDSAGYDVWLTDPVPFPSKMDYLPNLYPLLLKKLKLNVARPRPELFLKPSSLVFPKEYIVLHLGTSNPLKEWEVEKWRELATYLKGQGFTLLFTGKGKREKTLIQQAFQGLGEEFCDLLNWNDFMCAIAGAKALISVDSVSVHLSALFNIPTIALCLYSHGVELWLPDIEKGSFLIGKGCILKNREKHPKAIYLDEVRVLDVIEVFTSFLL